MPFSLKCKIINQTIVRVNTSSYEEENARAWHMVSSDDSSYIYLLLILYTEYKTLTNKYYSWHRKATEEANDERTPTEETWDKEIEIFTACFSSRAVAALQQGAPGQMTWLEDPPLWLKPWLRPA